MKVFFPLLVFLLCVVGARAWGCAALADLAPDGNPRFRLNIVEDYKRLTTSQLLKQGVNIDPNLNFDETMYRYFNLERRKLPQKKWKVAISYSLAKRLQDNNLPMSIHGGIDSIIDKAKKGKDLTPYLSRQIGNLDYEDGLLNDWGIYHLHLGTQFDNQTQTISRTNELLFAYQKGDTLYLIDVLPHQGSFQTLELLQIISKSWPDALKDYKLAGNKFTMDNPSDDQIRQMRKSGFSYGFMLGGDAYVSPGGGYAMSGHSIESTRKTDRLFVHLKRVEAQLREREDELRTFIQRRGTPAPETLDLELLWMYGNKVMLLEKNSKTEIPVTLRE